MSYGLPLRVSMPLSRPPSLAILIAIYGPGIGKGIRQRRCRVGGANHVTSWTTCGPAVRTDGFYRPVVATTLRSIAPSTDSRRLPGVPI
jgi:hypothetical protein